MDLALNNLLGWYAIKPKQPTINLNPVNKNYLNANPIRQFTWGKGN